MYEVPEGGRVSNRGEIGLPEGRRETEPSGNPSRGTARRNPCRQQGRAEGLVEGTAPPWQGLIASVVCLGWQQPLGYQRVHDVTAKLGVGEARPSVAGSYVGAQAAE